MAGVAFCSRSPRADTLVVALFALLHDARRFDEGYDPAHGPRAAALAGKLARSGILLLDPERQSLLRRACARHTHAKQANEPTLGACWDADRLDLRRLQLEIDPNRMFHSAEDIRTIIDEIDRGCRFPGWRQLLNART